MRGWNEYVSFDLGIFLVKKLAYKLGQQQILAMHAEAASPSGVGLWEAVGGSAETCFISVVFRILNLYVQHIPEL
jgi:hypothetical protein